MFAAVITKEHSSVSSYIHGKESYINIAAASNLPWRNQVPVAAARSADQLSGRPGMLVLLPNIFRVHTNRGPSERTPGQG